MLTQREFGEIEKELGIFYAQLPILKDLSKGVIARRELEAVNPGNIAKQKDILGPTLVRDLKDIPIIYEGLENVPDDLHEEPLVEIANHTMTRLPYLPTRGELIRTKNSYTLMAAKPNYFKGPLRPFFRYAAVAVMNNKKYLREKIIQNKYGKKEVERFFRRRDETSDYEIVDRILEGEEVSIEELGRVGEGATYLLHHAETLKAYEQGLHKLFMEKAGQAFELGYGVHILGDGTRASGQEPHRFGVLRKGGIEIALEFDRRILPIAFSNAESIYRRGFYPFAQQPLEGKPPIVRYMQIVDIGEERRMYNAEGATQEQKAIAIESARKKTAHSIQNGLEPTHQNLELRLQEAA